MGTAEGGWTEQFPARWNGRPHPAESCLAAWRLARAPALRPGRRGDHGPEPCSQGVHAVTHAATGQRRTSARPHADQRAARFLLSLCDQLPASTQQNSTEKTPCVSARGRPRQAGSPAGMPFE